jgi:hypothetical protein
MAASDVAESTVLDPFFKLVLLIVTGLTVGAFLIMVALAFTDATNAPSKDLFKVCSDAFKVGFGAIVGLLGGKAL